MEYGVWNNLEEGCCAEVGWSKKCCQTKTVDRTEAPDSEGDQKAAHLTGHFCYNASVSEEVAI
jgi:hypothetical protein